MTLSEQFHLCEILKKVASAKRNATQLPAIPELGFLRGYLENGPMEVDLFQRALIKSRRP